jgi:hypothetical protein
VDIIFADSDITELQRDVYTLPTVSKTMITALKVAGTMAAVHAACGIIQMPPRKPNTEEIQDSCTGIYLPVSVEYNVDGNHNF